MRGQPGTPDFFEIQYHFTGMEIDRLYPKYGMTKTSPADIVATLELLMTKEQRIAFREKSSRSRLAGDRKMLWRMVYAPKGIDTITDKPVYVRILMDMVMSSFLSELRRGREYVRDGEAYLVVYADSYLNIPPEPARDVKFISYSDLLARTKEKKLSRLRIEDIKRRISSTLLDPQERLKRKAARALRCGHVTLILGSGVSVDAGSPTWNDLLKGIMSINEEIQPLGEEHFDSINKQCGYSPLITARYVIGNSLDSKTLVESMRAQIYTNDKHRYNNDHPVLPVLADIIKGGGVKNAITFNYDEFLEEALEKVNFDCTSYYDKGALKEGFPVYHVHGLIPRDENLGASTNPVLAEQEYHSLYSNDFHWSNVEILHDLIRNTCFFVGLSMADPNLRRLLDIARMKDEGECRHFVFLRRTPLDKNNPSTAHDRKHQELLEKQFRDMRVNIIWYDYNASNPADHSDLARILEEICSKAKSEPKTF